MDQHVLKKRWFARNGSVLVESAAKFDTIIVHYVGKEVAKRIALEHNAALERERGADWDGIFLKEYNWTLYRHPTFHKKGADVTDVSYEWVMRSRQPGDRQARTMDEVEVIRNYAKSLKVLFNRLT